MSAWIVYSKDGKTERCRLKALEYSGSFMADRAVTATFECHSEVAFEVFDYIVYRGEKFELESVPSVKKTSSDRYEYELRFVSLKYELERCEMRDIVPNDNGVVYPTPLTFSFTGDVRYLAERIQANLDALYGKDVWHIVVAENAVSEEKNITIAQQNCWNALSTVNTTYGLNFSVRGREVVIGGELDSVDHTFQYGKGNGLYEIERASDTNTGIVTKLRAYGGTRNLDYSYPKQPEWGDSVLPVSFALSPLRLMLPSFKEDGKTDFVLADEATIAEYGIREASIIYEDIYPSITGVTNENGEAIDEIAGVDEIDESKSTFVVYLHDLGFDLNDHLTTSEAQLSMKTGTLQGYTFTLTAIERLQNGGYKITLGRNSLENSEETGAYVPSKNWNMKAGDKFVLLNILMPQTYIREAEQRLLARANEYLAEYSKTNFSYNVGLHDKFLVEHTSVYDSLIEGVKLNVYDAELGISEYVTIQSITITEDAEDNILPQVKVTLNNKPSASTLDRIQGKLNDVIAETSANSFSSQSELMKQYRKKLDKPFFDKLFSAVDADGNEIASNDMSTPIAYIKAKYDFMVLGGVTMYGNDESLDLPTLAEGLPFDQRTIWFNPETEQIEVIGGTGGGVSNFWDLGGIPSWITNTKPVYNYSEIKNTPDLSGYATTSSLNAVSTKLNDFLEGSDTDTVINKWKELETFLSGLTESDNLATILTGKADKSYVDTNFVTIAGTEDVTGLHDFVNGLKIGGIELIQKNGNAFLKGNLVVEGGITMYGDGEGGSSIPSYSTLGSLLNVDESNDAVASVDRVLFQSAGSNVWSWKALSEIGGGSSGSGSVSGDYLPLANAIYHTKTQNPDPNTKYDNWMGMSNKNTPDGTNYYHILSSTWDNMYWSSQLALPTAPSSNMYYRKGVSTSAYSSWIKVLDANNYSDYALPLSGGTINGKLIVKTSLDYPFTVFRNTSAASYIAFENKDGYLGDLGFLKDGTFYVYTNGVNERILHSGNISSYNAGSATKLQTARTIWGQSFNGTGDVSGTLYTDTIRGTNNHFVVGSSDSGVGLGGIHTGTYTTIAGETTVFKYTNSNESMRITSSGDVGIGTTSPSRKLDVNGSMNVSTHIYLGNTLVFNSAYLAPVADKTVGPTTSLVLWRGTGGNQFGIVGYYSDRFIFGNYKGGVDNGGINVYDNGNITTYGNGNFGIGTTSPSHKLHVAGTIASSALIVKGNPTTQIHLYPNNAGASYYCEISAHMSTSSAAKVNMGLRFNTSSTSDRHGANAMTLFNSRGHAYYDASSHTFNSNILTAGGITMYSDIRKKTILNHVELSLKQIADAPLIEHYYNSDQNKTTHVGSIAQYWAELNDWFCKLDNEGFYTMEIQNCALASAISIARHLEKYESKTDKTIRMLKKRIKELEDEVEQLKKN